MQRVSVMLQTRTGNIPDGERQHIPRLSWQQTLTLRSLPIAGTRTTASSQPTRCNDGVSGRVPVATSAKAMMTMLMIKIVTENKSPVPKPKSKIVWFYTSKC